VGEYQFLDSPGAPWAVRTRRSHHRQDLGLRAVGAADRPHGVAQLERALGAVPRQEPGQAAQQPVGVGGGVGGGTVAGGGQRTTSLTGPAVRGSK
jgi:hypothetical protein